MSTAQYDLEYLKASVEVLQDFVLSKEIYWPLTLSRSAASTTGLTRLSLGALLWIQARINPSGLSNEGRLEWERLTGQIDAIKRQWLSHWRQKAQKEIPGRITLWANYLSEIQQESKRSAENYPQQIRWRVILELLGQQTGQTDLVSSLDAQLNAHFKPGPFIWETDLEPQFPEKPYWYLYGKPVF